MAQERVRIERDGAVAHVIMARPDKMNGLDMAMFEGLIAAGRELQADNAVRAVVLSGEGKAFCAGLDFMAFMSTPNVGQKLLERPADSPANTGLNLGQHSDLPTRETPPAFQFLHCIANEVAGGWSRKIGITSIKGGTVDANPVRKSRATVVG